jgi:ribonuclease D
MPGYRDLDERRKGVFRRVYDIRDKYAQTYNVPPYRIIENASIINIVEDIDSISRMRFPGTLNQEAVKELLNELRRASEEPK